MPENWFKHLIDGELPSGREPGVYAVSIRLRRRTELEFGRTSTVIPGGYCVYIGSAMGGLQGRLGRHVRGPHSGHWHLDSLLGAGELADVQIRFTENKEDECRLAGEVADWPGATPITGFGCTDCRCRTHLYHFRSPLIQSVRAAAFLKGWPDALTLLNEHYLNHALADRDPFQSLISCILSLRTKDPVTAAASSRLFAEFATVDALAAGDPARVAELIHPVGMFRQKAKTVIEVSRILVTRYGGSVPPDMDQLCSLPGVGRKTANLVRSFAFHIPSICVDTHVHRITNRWGLVRTAKPDQTEVELRRLLPEEYWIELNPLLVQHGQQVCRPTGPRCTACPLSGLCRYADLAREQILLARIHGCPAHPCLISGRVRP